jgi:spore germination protein YaaH
MFPHDRPHRPVVAVVLLALVLTVVGTVGEAMVAPAPTAAADPGIQARRPRPTALSHEVYGYLPYWDLHAGTARQIDYRLVSTIAIFAVPIGPSGRLVRSSPGYRAYVGRAARAVTNAAHGQGVRVVPTFQLFDGPGAPRTRAFLHSRVAQARFIREAVTLIRRRGADGANLDLEPMPGSLVPAYAAFVATFRTAVHRATRGGRLVVATYASTSAATIRRLGRAADQLFVMAYDYHRPGSTVPGSVAPIRGGQANVARDIARYVAVLGPNRIILGLPYYGYSWPVVRTGARVLVRTDVARRGGVRGVTYAAALRFLAAHPTTRVHRDGAGGLWFRWYDAAHRTVRQVNFEDPAAVRAKADLAIGQGLAGVGIWTLGADRGFGGMAAALRAKFVRPTHRLAIHPVRTIARRAGAGIRVDATIRLTNRGSVPERGLLTWRIVSPSGRRVGIGRRLVVVPAGRAVTVRLATGIGRAADRRAGVYRLATVFSGARVWSGPVSRFRQPY